MGNSIVRRVGLSKVRTSISYFNIQYCIKRHVILKGSQAKRQEPNTTLQEMSESVMAGGPSSEAGKGGPPFPLIELPLGDFSSFYYRIQVAMANAHVSF